MSYVARDFSVKNLVKTITEKNVLQSLTVLLKVLLQTCAKKSLDKSKIFGQQIGWVAV